MGELVKLIEQYLEYMVLGTLAVCLLRIPLRASSDKLWSEWTHRVWSVVARKRVNNERIFWRSGLILATLFFLGFQLNAIGYWFLTPAHEHVIKNASKIINNDGSLAPDNAFFLSPATGHWDAVNDEDTTYMQDVALQVRWQVCWLDSYDALLEGAIKQVRIFRGVILLSVLLAVASAIAFARNCFLTSPRPLATPGAVFVFSVTTYWLTMGAYWTQENNIHQQLWSVDVPQLILEKGDVKLHFARACEKRKSAAPGEINP